MTSEAFDTLWLEVLAAWADPQRHDAFLVCARAAGRLADAAARYRALRDDPERGAEARRRLGAIALLAASSLEAHRSRPFTLSRRAALLVSLPLLLIALYALARALAG